MVGFNSLASLADLLSVDIMSPSHVYLQILVRADCLNISNFLVLYVNMAVAIRCTPNVTLFPPYYNLLGWVTAN